MVRIAIIGSGFGLYGLLPAFNSIKGCKVVAICGKKSDRMINYCQSIGLEKIYTDWQEMLDKEDLDAIAIAVTPSAQYEIAKVAIKKGLHIFAEKPLAATYLQAKELLTLAKKKKIKHGVDFIFPEIIEWQEVKKILDQKTFGKLKQINLNWDFISYDIKNKKSSWKTDSSLGGGALSFYFSHSLYYLEYFAGKIKNIKGNLLSFSKESINGAETGIDLLLEFESGVIGNAHLNCNAPGINRHQLMFICQKGTIILESQDGSYTNFNITISDLNGPKELSIKKDQGLKNEDERVKIIRQSGTRFISSIIDNKDFYPSFAQGLRVQKLIDIIRT